MFTSGRQGLFNQYRWLISRLQWLLDGAVVVALLIVICGFFAVPLHDDYFILGAIAFLLTLMVFHGSRLYRPWRGVYLGQLVRQVFLAWILVAAILAVVGYITKTSDIFSRRVLLTWFALVPIALVALRLQVYLGLRWLRESGFNSRTAVIAGAGDLGRRLGKNVVDTAWLGMMLHGFFDDALSGQEIELYSGSKAYPVLGT
jgi:FlaA1/EpsC-like NDP-sugar epimerase